MGPVRQGWGKEERVSEPGAKRTGADGRCRQESGPCPAVSPWAVASINVHLQEIRYFLGQGARHQRPAGG